MLQHPHQAGCFSCSYRVVLRLLRLSHRVCFCTGLAALARPQPHGEVPADIANHFHGINQLAL